MMHGHERLRHSSWKPTNKGGGKSAAEPVEPRAEAKGNVGQQGHRQSHATAW